MTSFMVVGNVTRDAVTRMVTNKDGSKTLATSFTVAVNDAWGSNGDEIVTYYKATIWGQRGANLQQWLKKGKDVVISGIPGQEAPWTGQDGQIRAGSMTIRRAVVELRGKKIEATVEYDGDEYIGQPVEE